MALKLRSFLAVLGVLVGTASVVAMISGGQLATRQALQQLTTLGSNLLSLSISTNTPSSTNIKNQPYLEVILKLKSVSPHILKLSPYSHVFSISRFKGHRLFSNVIAATDVLADLIKLPIQMGRFLSPSE